MSKWKEFEAKTAKGDKRVYNIKLLSCEAGLRLWQENFGDVLLGVSEMSSAMSADGGDLKIDLIQIGLTIVRSFTWDQVKSLAKELLANAEISDGQTKQTLDDSGFGDYFAGNPIEFFTAIYHAAMVNYAPLMEQLKISEKKKETKAE